MGDASSGVLFTVGYQDITVASLVQVITSAGVTLLGDVRAVPQSRKPGFSKSHLAGSLHAAGIEYLHVRPLGTPKEGRIAARRGDVATLARIFSDHLAADTPQAALVDLAGRARGRLTCLLCFERDHRHCHRAIVAERVAATTGLKVVHLLPGLPAGERRARS